jgi:maltose O-acetyltransferase
LQFALNNLVVNRIPSWWVRSALYRLQGMRIGEGARIAILVVIHAPRGVTLGPRSVINEEAIVDGRGGVLIGADVSVSMRATILSASHDPASEDFHYRARRTVLEDRVWVGAGAVVLDGAHVGRGTVLAAGSVLHGRAEPWTIYGGIPARAIGVRPVVDDYRIDYRPHFR